MIHEVILWKVIHEDFDGLVQCLFKEMKDINAGKASVKYYNYKKQGINVKIEVVLMEEDREDEDDEN